MNSGTGGRPDVARRAGSGAWTAAPVLGLGFRPFYLLAGLLATLWLPLWLAMLTGALPFPEYFPPVQWHAHEMIFGFTMAVMSGFLLTAVRNWTGRPTPAGGPLAALALLWIAGRVLMLAGGAVPGWAVAAVDAAFLPALAGALLVPLVRARNRRNIAFPLVLLALAAANVLMHLQALGIVSRAGGGAMRFALDAITLVLVVMAGRVVPAFTANAIPAAGVRAAHWIDGAAVALVLAVLIAHLVPGGETAAGGLLVAAALANGARMIGWRSLATRRAPILWILHLGYAWIVLALALEGLAALGAPLPRPAGVHALTAGAIGSLTLAMMTRSALGHTGRPLIAAPAIVLSYWMVNLAAVVRVAVPLLLPAWYLPGIVLSGASWTLAFGLFVLVFAPILTRPRVDGVPG